MIYKIYRYIKDLVIFNVGLNVDYPSFVNFSVSNRCNARCLMCDIWKYPSSDMSALQLEFLLNKRYFRKVVDFGITGGEPFLRNDLPELIDVISTKLPSLKFIGITTNGFCSSRMNRMLKQILPLLSERKITLQISVSVDGIGEVHNLVRGVPKVFRKVDLSVNRLINLRNEYSNLKLTFACTITNQNSEYIALSELEKYMKEKSIPGVYRLAVDVDRIYNKDLIASVGIDNNDKNEGLVQFYSEQLIKSSLFRRAYYRMIIQYLMNKQSTRSVKCKEQRDGIMMDSNGDIYTCSVAGELIGNGFNDSTYKLIMNSKTQRYKVMCNNCSSCWHDHASHVPLIEIIRYKFNV